MTLVAGAIAWLTYGADIPLILANAATLLLTDMILFFKIRNGCGPPHERRGAFAQQKSTPGRGGDGRR